LRFPEFTEPWEQHLTTDYFEFKNGLNPDVKRFGTGVKFISVMDILNNRYISYDRIISSVEPKGDDLKDFGVNYGDILFQRSSETLEDVGRANVYLDKRTAIFGGFVIRGKKIGNYDPLFFRYLLTCPTVRKRIIVKGAGAQHFNIGQDGLSKVHLSVPSEKEQKRISDLLNLIDERIETQSKLIEDLQQLKSALVERLYCQHNPNFKIGDLVVQVSKRNRGNNDYSVLSVNNRLGFIEQSEQFEDRSVASEDTSNYKVVSRDDFAYNPARINVGSIARLTSFESGIVSPMYICFHTKKQILPQYLEHFFDTRYFYYEMQKRLEGSVRLCLSWEGLCNIPIAAPPIEQQEKVSKRISRLADKISLEELHLDLLKSQKRYLLQTMFI
jgi:type I restriction enzyme S subunit